MEILLLLVLGAIMTGKSTSAAPAKRGRGKRKATDYTAKLEEIESPDFLSYHVKRTRRLLGEWPSWLDKYRGGMPRGCFAAIMDMESGGRMDSPGDPSLGEVGWYQVTSEFPRSIGIDPALRYNKEWNMFLGGAEYNLRARQWLKRIAGLTIEDAWLMARLSFAIGDSGARRLVASWRKRNPSGAFSYASLVGDVEANGAPALGSQSAAKVVYRVHVPVVNFQVGQTAEPGNFAAPAHVESPDRRPWRW